MIKISSNIHMMSVNKYAEFKTILLSGYEGV